MSQRISYLFTYLVISFLISFSLTSHSKEEKNISPPVDSPASLNEKNKLALKMFSLHPELFPQERRQSILKGIVELGMTPYEAHLAGGEFNYSVVADKLVWPEHSNPLNIMWAQSKKPDNSEIWMQFKNSTQFINKNETSFKVYFQRGRAVKIERKNGV